MRGWGWVASIALLTLALGLAVLLPSAQSQDTEVKGHVLSASRVPATPERIKNLRVPSGFRVDVFAEGRGRPRMLAVAEDGASLALHGSWNRKPPSGYEVVFIRFDERGSPQSIEPFLSGFLVSGSGAPEQFGRPCGVAVLKDGSLLVTDDANGILYRIDTGGPRAAL